MSDTREILAELFEAELDRTEERSPVKIELVYSPPGFQRETLRIWHTKDVKDAWAFDKAPAHRNRLVHSIMDLATQRSDAEGGSTRKMFRVIIHQANSDRTPCAFSILPTFEGADAELARDDGGGNDIQPTVSGTLGQVLKQNRDLHKTILKGAQQNERVMSGIANLVNSMTKHQSEHQSHLWDRIEQLEDQRVKHIELVEEAKTMSHDRMLEEKVVSSEQDRKDKAMETFETIGKAIVSHLMQKKTTGDAPEVVNGTPDVTQLPAMLSHFMASLSKDQRDELTERLPMEHKLALAEIQRSAMSNDVASTYKYVATFMSKLDEPVIDMLEEVLTGKQKKLLDQIFELVRDMPPPNADTNGARSQPITS